MILSIIISLSAFILATSLVILVIPQILAVTTEKRLFDVPCGRKAHALPTPTAGGVAIFIGMMVSVFTFSMNQEIGTLKPLLATIVVLFFLGLKDDLIGEKASTKLLIQIFLAAILVFGGLGLDTFWQILGLSERLLILKYGGSILLIVFLTNAYNMIDGIDGLAGGIGMIASLTFGIVLMMRGETLFAVLAFATAGSLLGFLKFNFQPAKIFMGDTGSLVVGVVISILMMQVLEGSAVPGAFASQTAPLIVLAALAIPIVDMIQVVISRLLAGKHPFSADRRHLHHKLLTCGLGHRCTTVLLSCLTMGFILVSLLVTNSNVWIGLFNMASVIVSMFLLLQIWNHKAVEKKQKELLSKQS
jgi:UDP-N-acetylmuramyl pentapeptide phosphotransferase/UDP-N-acetylglucosamine-1-phosphate transferase